MRVNGRIPCRSFLPEVPRYKGSPRHGWQSGYGGFVFGDLGLHVTMVQESAYEMPGLVRVVAHLAANLKSVRLRISAGISGGFNNISSF